MRTSASRMTYKGVAGTVSILLPALAVLVGLPARATAAEAQHKVLLVAAGEGQYTARALKALGTPFERRSAAAFRAVSPFDYDVIIWGLDESRSTMGGDPESIRAFLEAGGVMLCLRSNDADGWLPATMERDKSYEFGKILLPDHPVFRLPHQLGAKEIADVHGGSIYRAFCRLAPTWTPLISTGKPQAWDKTPERLPAEDHFGLAEMPLGRGRLIMTQMIPEYHWFHDTEGDASCAGARFFENLVRYALACAHAEAASRPPRTVPEAFVNDLAELIAVPCGFGSERPPALDWETRTEGPYSAKSDRRGVWTVTHGDTASAAGSFCELVRDFGPQRAGERASLRWYVSDTYCGGRERVLGGADHGKTAFVNQRKGHRFVQVLVNGTLVWEEDVLGRNPQPARRRVRTADITEALRGNDGRCRVSLRVEDRKGSGDQPFAIDVFWGAVAVLPGLCRVPAGQLSPEPATPGLAVTLAAGRELTYRHRGAAGRFRLAFRIRDNVTDRAVLGVAVGGAQLTSWELTADDHRWHWALTPPVDLGSDQEVVLGLTGAAGVTCPLQEMALLPEALLASRVQRQPAKPQAPAAPPAASAFTVTVAETAGSDRIGEVATQGLPFAPGAVRDAAAIRVGDDAGAPVPSQASAIVSWPDGSVRVGLVSFPVSLDAGETKRFSVRTTGGRPPPPMALAIRERGDSITVDTGVITAAISKTHGRIVDSVRRNDGQELLPDGQLWDLALEDADGRVLRTGGATVSGTTFADRGPLRVLIVRTGSFADAAGTLIDYRLQVEATAGSSALGLEAIIINREDSAETYLKRWSMRLAGLDPAAGRVWLGQDDVRQAAAGNVLYQHREDRLSWTGPGPALDWAEGSSPGLFRIGEIAVGARWFWERFPQAIRFREDGVRFDFIPEAMDERDLPKRWQARMEELTKRYSVGGVGYPQSPGKMGLFRLARGEALHQELRFVFGDRSPDAATVAAMAPLGARVRAVADPVHSARTQAFGQFHPANRTFPRYEASLDSLYENYLVKRRKRREYGFENFGDDTFEWGYGPSYTYWSNSEYDHHHGFAIQYLRSAEPRWWELAEQQARMYRDVVVIHQGPDGLRGGPRHHNATSMWMPQHEEQYWVADHTASGPSCGHSWVQGMIDYWFLTGDPWSGEVVRELSDWYCNRVETNGYGAGGQERGPGWTLIAVSALASALQTERIMAAGQTVADWVADWQDPMRGVLSIPISEQPSYEGGTTFMHGIVGRGLGRWYDLTGDPRTRLACIGIAEWMTTEPMGPIARFWYKQSPQNSRRYGATSQCFTALTYAHQLTDDPWFSQVAMALYRQTGAGSRSISWYPQALAQIAPAITPAEVSLDQSEIVIAPGTPGKATLRIRNTTEEPVDITVSSGTWTMPAAGNPPIGATMEEGPIDIAVPEPLSVPPGEERETSVEFRAKSSVEWMTGWLRVELRQAGREPKRVDSPLTVRAIERLVRIELTADKAVLSGPMVLDTSGETPYLHTPRTPEFVAEPRPQTGEAGGHATFVVDVPAEGEYGLEADVFWVDGEGNSFYISIDGEPDRAFGNSGDMICWTRIADSPVELTQGKHTIRIRTREDGARLSRLILHNTPAK